MTITNIPEWSGKNITLTTPYTQSSDILIWQKQMILLGYDLGLGGETGKGDDGIFGKRSLAALQKFQQDRELKVDGILGPISWDTAWADDVITPDAKKILSVFEIDDVLIQKFESESVFFFKSGMNIDADGTPNAYHPENIGIDYLANAGYPGSWWGLATDSNGNPLIQEDSDPYPGYYISQTALIDNRYIKNDTRRYVNSVEIPYIVLPGNRDFREITGIQLGDFSVVYNMENEKFSYAIYADIGPKNEIGEGSVALAKSLGHDPFVNGKVKRSIQKNIVYVVFPKSGDGKPREINEIKKEAEIYFNQWGGISKLKDIFL
ncbi:MAG: hypothetical protein GY749_31305 [Desulfobacteraceae bacterium]|nr:hypothetical protein [Desulfobacteraceae bacterium]